MVVLSIDIWEFPLIFSSSSLIWCCLLPCIRRRHCNGVCQGLVSFISNRTVYPTMRLSPMEITNLPPSMLLPPLLPNHTWWLPRQVSWTTVPNWQQMKHHQRTPQQRRSSLRRMWNYSSNFTYHDTTYMRLVETAPYIFLYSYMMIWSLWPMKHCQSQQRRFFLEPHIHIWVSFCRSKCLWLHFYNIKLSWNWNLAKPCLIKREPRGDQIRSKTGF